MNSRAIGILLGLALIPVVGAYQVFYSDNNYDELEATLVSTSTDCYLERDQKEFRRAGSDEIAYFDCSTASNIAAANGFGAEDIKKHARLTYSYVSPFDKLPKQVEYEVWREGLTPENMKEKRSIYISRNAPEKHMWSKNFIF